MTEVTRFSDKGGNIISRRAMLAGALGLTAEIALGGCGGEAKTSRELFTKQPTWEQNFSKLPDGSVDESVWRIRRGPNNTSTLQTNTDHPENLRIQAGRLHITALRERLGDREFTSARIDTGNSFTFTYGKIEIDAQFSQGAGALDALWSVAAHPHPDIHTTNKNPAAHGEIDIAEHPARKGNLVHINAHTLTTLENQSNGLVQDGGHIVTGASTGLHTYGLELSPGLIVWTADGQQTGKLAKPDGADAKIWPFDIPRYLIMQLTIGGAFAGDPDPGLNEWHMSVGAVRYYPLKEAG